MNYKLWLKGLISAVIGWMANAITLMIVDPLAFNLAEGYKKLGIATLVSALVSLAMYLKASPLPNGDK